MQSEVQLMVPEVNLVGGIGNQFFGATFGLAVGLAAESSIVLSDRLIPFGSNKSRRLEVDKLLIFSNERARFFKSSNERQQLLAQSDLARRFVWKYYQLTHKKYLINEDQFWDLARPASKYVFSGYFDDWFFAEYLRKNTNFNLKNDFKTKVGNSGIVDLVRSKETIVCHVRLGDLLDLQHIYTLPSQEFFLGAIEKLQNLNGASSANVLVFTEDYGQFNRHYPILASRANKIITRDEISDDLESFLLMANSRNIVASNSTFSHWASWFVQKDGGHAIIPVFGDSLVKLEKSGARYQDWMGLDATSGLDIIFHPELRESWYEAQLIKFDRVMSILSASG